MAKTTKKFNAKIPTSFAFNEDALETPPIIQPKPIEVIEPIITIEEKSAQEDTIVEEKQEVQNKISKSVGISQKALSAGLDNPTNTDEEGKLTIKNLREVALIKEKNEKITYNVTYYKDDLDSLKLIKDITKIPIQQLFRDIMTLGIKQLSENVKTSEEYKEFQKRIKLL
jgi:hypothetical protein